MTQSIEGSNEGARDVAVAMLPILEELARATVELDAVDMDKVTPDYDSLRQAKRDAERAINSAHAELYSKGFSQADVLRGTGRAKGIIKGLDAASSSSAESE